ncbi:MAG: PIN domain-containing protein [Acidobacteria bacterium]|nr:PIN domain-containing protein [Acidobacteriota bacterium]
MTSLAVVDSGPLLAAANKADPDHRACVEALRDPAHRLVIPALCVAEVSYLLGRRSGPETEARFLRALAEFDVRAPAPEEWTRIAQLVAEYADFPLGGTDASVISLAERLGTDLVITLDRRHFGAVRPEHCERFRILP